MKSREFGQAVFGPEDHDLLLLWRTHVGDPGDELVLTALALEDHAQFGWGCKVTDQYETVRDVAGFKSKSDLLSWLANNGARLDERGIAA